MLTSILLSLSMGLTWGIMLLLSERMMMLQFKLMRLILKALNEARRSVKLALIQKMSSSTSSNKNGMMIKKQKELFMQRIRLQGKSIWISWKGIQKLLALLQSHSKSWRNGGISLLEYVDS